MKYCQILKKEKMYDQFGTADPNAGFGGAGGPFGGENGYYSYSSSGFDGFTDFGDLGDIFSSFLEEVLAHKDLQDVIMDLKKVMI